jgi:hypothetical protein
MIPRLRICNSTPRISERVTSASLCANSWCNLSRTQHESNADFVRGMDLIRQPLTAQQWIPTSGTVRDDDPCAPCKVPYHFCVCVTPVSASYIQNQANGDNLVSGSEF